MEEDKRTTLTKKLLAIGIVFVVAIIVAMIFGDDRETLNFLRHIFRNILRNLF